MTTITIPKKLIKNRNMSSQIFTPTKYVEKLEKLEKEILKLKKGGLLGIPKKIAISLKGILKGVEITEKEIEDAKKSLFKEIKI